MKKVIIPILIILLLLSLIGYFLLPQIFKKEVNGALQISALPKSTVYLDDKQVGNTPFYDDKIKSGEHNVKIVPELENNAKGEWSGRIKITPNTLTAIDWQFDTEGKGEGYSLSLEPGNSGTAELLVISTPDQAQVKLNNETKGTTPLIIKDLKDGEQQVLIEKEGYNSKSIKARTISKYRLTINIELYRTQNAGTSTDSDKNATQSASLKNQIIIVKETPTGWLRVRTEPSLAASEAAKVNPGDELPYLEEKEGWTKIEYVKGKFGWVSSQYVEKKQEESTKTTE